MSPITMIAIGTGVTIIGAIIAGIGTYRQHLASSEKTSKILELSHKNNELARENRVIVEKSRDSITSHFNKELAEFGIKYDASQEKFERIIKQGGIKPALMVCTGNGIEFISHDNNVLKLKISFCGKEATCFNVNLKIRTLTFESSLKQAYVNKGDLLFGPDIIIPVGDYYSTELHIANEKPFDTVFILVRGTYWDTGKTLEQRAEFVINYNVKTKAFGLSRGEEREQAIHAFNTL